MVKDERMRERRFIPSCAASTTTPASSVRCVPASLRPCVPAYHVKHAAGMPSYHTLLPFTFTFNPAPTTLFTHSSHPFLSSSFSLASSCGWQEECRPLCLTDLFSSLDWVTATQVIRCCDTQLLMEIHLVPAGMLCFHHLFFSLCCLSLSFSSPLSPLPAPISPLPSLLSPPLISIIASG